MVKRGRGGPQSVKKAPSSMRERVKRRKKKKHSSLSFPPTRVRREKGKEGGQSRAVHGGTSTGGGEKEGKGRGEVKKSLTFLL